VAVMPVVTAVAVITAATAAPRSEASRGPSQPPLFQLAGRGDQHLHAG
jgi:hypothetical protein